MGGNKLITCAACGVQSRISGRGNWQSVHTCPKAGQDASAYGTPDCPIHGASLVWVVGPWSTYRQCIQPTCGAGRDKTGHAIPFRVYPGKGPNTPEAQPERTERDAVPVAVQPEGSKPTVGEHEPTTNTAYGLKHFGALGEAIQAYVDARATELSSEIVADAMASIPTRTATVQWQVNGAPFARIEGNHHKALPRMLKLYAAGVRNFLIVGPAGSGKTTLARDFARALSLGFAGVACSGGMSESALTGRTIPNLTTGGTSYQGTEFVGLYESGGVFLLDEVDAADANVLLVINGALANGHLPLPNRTDSPSASRHASSAIVCAANTWGLGADREYVGRNQLDAAFLDRFVGATLRVDYDRDLESEIVGDALICDRVWAIRDKATEMRLRRVVGTRFLLAVTRLVKCAGDSLDDALLACCEAWTTDERSKAGVR